MRLPQLVLWLLTLVSTIHAFALPSSLEAFSQSTQELWKRKGGGGGRGGGGGGSTSSGGGRTGTGSGSGAGTPRSYSGSYGGGSATSYKSGTGTAAGGRAPLYLGAGALAFLPGVYLYGVYAYGYSYPWYYRNNTSGRNETYPATCLCDADQECGCDDNNSTDYQNAVANNQSLSRVANINGTQTLVVNGTLPNGTADAEAYGSGAVRQTLGELSGWWVVLAGVSYTIWFM